MKLINTLLTAAITLTASNLALGSVADNEGEYTLGEIRIDGAAWTDASTEVAVGQSFDLEIDLSYTSSPSPDLLFEHDYFEDQTIDLLLASSSGSSLGSASATAPTSTTTDTAAIGGEYVTSAAWTLAGTGLFDAAFGDAGVYDIFFKRTPASYEIGDGLFPNFVAINQEITAKVPAPATLLLFAAGLFGLLRTRRSSKA